MKKSLYVFLVTCLFVGVYGFTSCVKPAQRGDSFEASFFLNNDVVYDGEEFAFTIETNRNQLKVKSFEFPLAPNMLTPNTYIDISEGIAVFKKKVSVQTSQRGRIALTVEDPVTGLTKEFTAVYTAYASTGISLVIENEVANSSQNPNYLPTVVEGDDFVFTVYSKSERLILKNFQFEYNDGTLKYGQEIDFVDNKKTFVIREVKVYDAFVPKTLSLTFSNPETQRDTTLSSQFITMNKFDPVVKLVDSELVNGQVAQVRISSNRQRFVLVSHDFPKWFEISDLYDDSVIDLGPTRSKTFVSDELVINSAEGGNLIFELKDVEYTTKKKVIMVPYTVKQGVDSNDFELSTDECSITENEIIPISIKDNTPYSNGLFHVQMLRQNDNGKLKFYAPKKGESHEIEDVEKKTFVNECDIEELQFFVKGGRDGGEFTVRVTAKNNKDYYRDLKVYVRYNVVFVVDGDFTAKLGHFSSIDKLADFGWYGFPELLYGYMASWPENIDPANYLDVTDRAQMRNLIGVLNKLNAKNYSVMTSLRVPAQRTSKYFAGIGTYKPGESGNPKNDTREPGAPWVNAETFPNGSISFEIQESAERLNSKGEFILEGTRGYLWAWDCWCVHYDYEVGNQKVKIEIPGSIWDYLDFRIEKVNTSEYNIKYIIYAFKATEPRDINDSDGLIKGTTYIYNRSAGKGWNTYWWHSIDRVPWIEKYEKE